MFIKQALQGFQDYLSTRGHTVDSLSPDSGFALLIAFYRERRFEGCSLERDGDMLLFQWGIYDWGEGKNFVLNLTRQFMEDDEEAEIYQLSLSFHFEPDEALRSLGEGNRWCAKPEDVADFEGFIRRGTPFQVASQHECRSVSLQFLHAD